MKKSAFASLALAVALSVQTGTIALANEQPASDQAKTAKEFQAPVLALKVDRYDKDQLPRNFRSCKDALTGTTRDGVMPTEKGLRDEQVSASSCFSEKELEKILATLQEHRQHLTRKGLIFEDMNNMLQQAEPLIHRLLFFDNLVNAYNRYFYVSYSSELFHRAGERGGLSMAFFDIDNFKQYNTDFGHETGDKVLQTVCDIIQRRIHTTEGLYLIRMGGDEFVILDDGVVDYDAFLRLLTEIRQAIASDRSIYGRSVTISIGASNAIADDAESTWDVYQHADARLYVAKNHGKNQIVSVG